MQAELKRLIQQVFWADSYEEGLKRGRALIARFQERIRSTNALERIIEEIRRRTKVLGRLPGEQAALKLVYAVASTYARRWRGIPVTEEQLAQIDRVVAEEKERRREGVLVTVGVNDLTEGVSTP